MIFVFICTTAFFSNNEDIYPAELAMAKFSLKEGIIDDLHIQINPDVLPLGSSADALETSEASHKYPLPLNAKGEKDYLEVLKSIVTFLHPMDKLPIIFGEGNTRDNKKPLEDTCRILDKIFYASGEDDVMKDLKIYSIDELFFALQKTVVADKNLLNKTFDVPFPFIAYATDILKRDSSQTLTNGCDFHNFNSAVQHCCLSKIRNFCYTFCKWCSMKTRYALNEGKHVAEGFEAT